MNYQIPGNISVKIIDGRKYMNLGLDQKPIWTEIEMSDNEIVVAIHDKPTILEALKFYLRARNNTRRDITLENDDYARRLAAYYVNERSKVERMGLPAKKYRATLGGSCTAHAAKLVEYCLELNVDVKERSCKFHDENGKKMRGFRQSKKAGKKRGDHSYWRDNPRNQQIEGSHWKDDSSQVNISVLSSILFLSSVLLRCVFRSSRDHSPGIS